MSSILEKELKKLNFDVEKSTDKKFYFIQKLNTCDLPIQLLEVGRSYEIEFSTSENSIEIISMVSSNWNHGKQLNHSIILCEVIKISGNMIQINGIGKDATNSNITSTYFNYWLNKDTLKRITAI